MQRIARDPFLADRFTEAIDKADSEPIRHLELPRFVERVGLMPLERLIIASSMLGATNRRDLVRDANLLIRNHFDQARMAIMSHAMFETGNLLPNQMTKLLSNLLCDPPSETPALDPTYRQSLLTAVATKYGAEFVLVTLKQILPRISMQPNTTLAQALTQFGPEWTSDIEVVRALMARFGITDANPPTDLQVLEAINRLARFAIEGSAMPDVRVLVRAFNTYVSRLTMLEPLVPDESLRMCPYNGTKLSGCWIDPSATALILPLLS